MLPPITCCQTCARRSVGCHGTCAEYQAQAAARRAMREAWQRQALQSRSRHTRRWIDFHSAAEADQIKQAKKRG